MGASAIGSVTGISSEAPLIQVLVSEVSIQVKLKYQVLQPNSNVYHNAL